MNKTTFSFPPNVLIGILFKPLLKLKAFYGFNPSFNTGPSTFLQNNDRSSYSRLVCPSNPCCVPINKLLNTLVQAGGVSELLIAPSKEN
jgi:hypothetical protein